MSICDNIAQFNRGFAFGAGVFAGFSLTHLWNRAGFCFTTPMPLFRAPMPFFNFSFPVMNMPTFIPQSPPMQYSCTDFSFGTQYMNTSNPFTAGSIYMQEASIFPSGNCYSSIGFDTFTCNCKKPKAGNIGNGTHCYETLDREEALSKAKKDNNLEELIGGNNWSICSCTFINDIPYARKGTSALLDRVCKEAGVTLTVTSALGTLHSPHVKGDSSESHYNEKNPKLDFGGGLSESEANELKKKLDKTGLFSRVAVENDGGTCHLDVQFKDSAYATV